jgi:predicted choloylglycine hydrolase
MPMNFLLREIMENASTVDEALEIFRKTPRTCEYYYVISDKKRNIVGVYSLSGKPIELIKPGEQNPKLPHIPEDTVIVSGRKRADVISQRIQDSYGKIEAKRMIEIIKRPAAMNSNLHNAVFAPETLDIWISDAGKKSPACDNYYAHFNLNNLLKFYEKAEEVKVTDND